MELGIDRSIQVLKKPLKNKKIGLLCHAATVDSRFTHILSLFQKLSINIAALFGPEHGLWGVAQDMETVEHASPGSVLNTIPTYSLYGSTPESLKPKKEWIQNLDAVVCDLQDVGSRYYTFIYSIAFMMEVCAEVGVPVYLLDRPNPINGIDVEGNMIHKGFESFVGAYPIANRHGMTVGEFANYLNEEFKINADLKVIPVKGWKRKSYLDETSFPWVLPSPNMPTLDTAIVYPGMCLLEATEISEGRGTTRPLEICGAPFIDPFELSKRLKEYKLVGTFFRPLYFKPMFQKWANQVCGGVQIHLTDRKRFKPYLTGLAVLKAIHDLYPKQFKWREKPYEFVKEIPAIDLLTGSDRFRKDLEAGKSFREIKENYEEGKSVFLKQRKKYLMYK